MAIITLGTAMRLLTYSADRQHIGVAQLSGIVEPLPEGPGWPKTMRDLIGSGRAFRDAYLLDLAEITSPSAGRLANMTLLAPITDPGRVIFVDGIPHERDGQGLEPLTVSQSADVQPLGPGALPLTEGLIKDATFHGRLTAVIGKPIRGAISQRQAGHAIFGYTAMCVLETGTRSQTCAIGPWLVTTEAILDPIFLVQATVAGRPSSRGQLRRSRVSSIVSSLSAEMPLDPGDLVAVRPPSLQASRAQLGDELAVEINGLGTLRNQIRVAP